MTRKEGCAGRLPHVHLIAAPPSPPPLSLDTGPDRLCPSAPAAGGSSSQEELASLKGTYIDGAAPPLPACTQASAARIIPADHGMFAMQRGDLSSTLNQPQTGKS
ncbi:hypothetical protein AAFF_G00074390 [Aldrovandia affinis]|uniref:Uncharacterized protein n=1 Tax=Aldrovandia affinis TaxID=143900 RepID=A0AAD7WCZ2_9TELE|nr:hypothetical protein AAFF_G00074390 [Aldrovandia affinis]